MADTAALLGGTGLIGSHLLKLLIGDGSFRKIKVLTRRPVNFNDPKTEVIVLDFSDHSAFRAALEDCDAIFCAVGTTQKKVGGDRTEYRKIDYDIPVNAARFGSLSGCRHFLLVSSVGAKSSSGNFYLRLKGEVEDTLQTINIPAISVFRPSMLLGRREESRPAERITASVIRPLSFLFPAKYKPVEASEVAEAMLTAYLRNKPGFHVYHYTEMKNIQGHANGTSLHATDHPVIT